MYYLVWALLGILFNFLNYFVWLRITDEGSVPEMRIWSISLIQSDLKWCIHLSRSLFFNCKKTLSFCWFQIFLPWLFPLSFTYLCDTPQSSLHLLVGNDFLASRDKYVRGANVIALPSASASASASASVAWTKTLTLAITLKPEVIGLSYCTCVFLVTRPFTWYSNFWPCDLDLEVGPTFEKL